MPRYEPFHIVVDRRPYAATWHLEGDDVCVSSAYGSSRAPLGRAKPEAVAERLLRELVKARLG